MPPLATIGYELDTLDGMIGRLKAAGVKAVVDVRAVAASRRPGFSKTMMFNKAKCFQMNCHKLEEQSRLSHN